jgi:AcrR family transcriptional regulator
MGQRRTQTEIRAAILDAADELIRDAPAELVTTRAIAAVAGVQQSVIYRYFGSREAMFAELSKRNIAAMRRTVGEHPDIASSLRATYEFVAGQPETLLAIARLVSAGRVQEVHAAEEQADVGLPMIQVLQMAVHRRSTPDDPTLQADYVLVMALLSGMALLGPYLEGIRAVRGVDHDLVRERLRLLIDALVDGEIGAAMPVSTAAG